MRTLHGARDAVLLALGFVCFQFFQVTLLKDVLVKQERASVHRLCVGIAAALNQAHRAKDDLLLYQVLGALEKAPGVVEARLVHSDDKPHGSAGSYIYVLRDGSQKWGSLVLAFSDHPSQRLVRLLWFAGIVTSALLWFVIIFYLEQVKKKAVQLSIRKRELEEIFQMEKRKRTEAEKREAQNIFQRAAWLEMALAQIPRPLLLLDGRQRLAAVNAPAAALLDSGKPRDLRGKSWQDVQGLSSCGAFLAESLEAPEQTVRRVDRVNGRTLEFFTMRSEEGLSGGTWVHFLKADESY